MYWLKFDKECDSHAAAVGWGHSEYTSVGFPGCDLVLIWCSDVTVNIYTQKSDNEPS